MRYTLTALMLAGVLATSGIAFAQTSKSAQSTAAKPAAAKSTSAATHSVQGVVKSVDTRNNTVMLAHEPVPSLKWPAMTMAFKAEDPKLIQGLTTGQKVNFEFAQRGKDYVLTSIK